mmetsp:Transcript_141259/g.451473  ORF Transcript_141259/g.451473 Transcript_141259/m.451473 type:complete len:205 (-) Transcript_141259:396-1010(-)
MRTKKPRASLNSSTLTSGTAETKSLPLVTALNSRSPIDRATPSATGGLAIMPRPCCAARSISRHLSMKSNCATRKQPSPMSTTSPPASRTRWASDASVGRWSSVMAMAVTSPAACLRQIKPRESPAQATKRRSPATMATSTVDPSGAVRNRAKYSVSSSLKAAIKAPLIAASSKAPGTAANLRSTRVWRFLAANSAHENPWCPS